MKSSVKKMTKMKIATGFKLSSNATIRYTPREQKLFRIIARRKLINTLEVMEKLYTNGDETPFWARQSALQAIGSLQRKIEANAEPFRLVKSKPKGGPHPAQFAIEG